MFAAHRFYGGVLVIEQNWIYREVFPVLHFSSIYGIQDPVTSQEENLSGPQNQQEVQCLEFSVIFGTVLGTFWLYA